MFGGVEFRRIGCQADQCDVVRNFELACRMIAGSVDDHHGVSSGRDGCRNHLQMLGKGEPIGVRHHERRADAAGRAGGAEDVGPVVAQIAWRPRARALLRPEPG